MILTILLATIITLNKVVSFHNKAHACLDQKVRHHFFNSTNRIPYYENYQSFIGK